MSQQAHQKTRSQLIDQLVAELPISKPRYHVYMLLLGWIFVAWFFSVAMTLLQAPLRSSWLEQLSASPQFLLEMSSGLVAVMLMALMVFQKAVPGLSRKPVLVTSVIVLVLWLGSLFAGLYFPALVPSMEGKRPLCELEIVAYSIPLMVAGFVIVRKGFVLNWPAAGFGIGLASGFIPALLMQLACMYNPAHALQCHVFPAVLLGAVGAGVGFIFHKLQR